MFVGHYAASLVNLCRNMGMLILSLLAIACAQQPALDYTTRSYEGPMPTDLSGSWERDYSRGDDINGVLTGLFYRLERRAAQRFPANPRASSPQASISQREVSSIVALARLAELITRPDVLTISQNDYEISVARRDDFSMLCEFYDGIAKGTTSDYGTEICTWDGDQLVSHLILPDGLIVMHRFSLSPHGKNMRVTTTVSSSTTRVPFTIDRYYLQFEPPSSRFNCMQTLSMKRVCSTGEIVP